MIDYDYEYKISEEEEEKCMESQIEGSNIIRGFSIITLIILLIL